MQPVRVGIVSRTATYWPLYLMERAGFACTLVELGATSAGVAALLERTVDVAATCPDALIRAGAPLRIAGGLVDRPPASLISVAELGDVAALRGRRVATTEPRGSVSLFLRALLRERGVRDYEQVALGTSPAQAAALERHEVDAAMLTFPFDARLVSRGFRRLAHVGRELGPCAFTTLNVRAGWTATDAWHAFRGALADAIALLMVPAERGEAVAVLAEATGISVAEPPDGLAFDTRLDARGLERLLGFMREERLLSEARPGRTYLDAGAVVR